MEEFNRKSLFISILFMTLTVFSLEAQTKKYPDELDGFREFKFYSSIDDYRIYDLVFYESEFLKAHYKMLPKNGESTFLGTEILEIRLFEYKNQLVGITLILKDDVKDILKEMFKDSPEYEKEQAEKEASYRELGISTSLSTSLNNSFFPSNCHDDYREPHYDEGFNEKLRFEGVLAYISYGENYSGITSYEKDWRPQCRFTGRMKSIENRFYLSMRAVDFKDKIDKKQVKEHYDTYISDFGIDHHPKSKEKNTYKIPLFSMGNSYLVKVLFGTNILHEMVLDTGSDKLIIGQDLYNSLNQNNLILDLDESNTFVNASGEIVKLKRVIVKELQINDLKIKAIEAFINDSVDISLLGQTFLKRFGKITIDHSKDLLIIER